MARVYKTKFDHDEARRRYAAGESGPALAREFGVSSMGIYRVVTPGLAERMLERSRRNYTAVCEDCGRPCLSVRHAAKRKFTPDGRNLCARCRGIVRRKSVRFNRAGELTAIRCTMTACANGERWQPPENFTRGQRFPDLRKGGFRKVCRACSTKLRREYRHTHPDQRARENRRQREKYRARKEAA